MGLLADIWRMGVAGTRVAPSEEPAVVGPAVPEPTAPEHEHEGSSVRMTSKQMPRQRGECPSGAPSNVPPASAPVSAHGSTRISYSSGGGHSIPWSLLDNVAPRCGGSQLRGNSGDKTLLLWLPLAAGLRQSLESPSQGTAWVAMPIDPLPCPELGRPIPTS